MNHREGLQYVCSLSLQLTGLFFFFFFIGFNRFWKDCGVRAKGLVVFWEEWCSGGNCAIKEAPGWGVYQQRTKKKLGTDLIRAFQQRAVRDGGHVDRTPARPRQPLCTSGTGWVWLIISPFFLFFFLRDWYQCGHAHVGINMGKVSEFHQLTTLSASQL